jgi:hypothetical protein
MTDTNKLNDAYLPAVVALALVLVMWVFASTRLQVLGASLMTIALIGLAVVSWFIHRDKAAEKANEDTKLKQIADELGVSEDKVTQVAIDRLHKQLFQDA